MTDYDYKKKYYFREEKDITKDWIGDGGFGSCYRASLYNSEEKRAIKIIDKNKLREKYIKEKFKTPSEEDMKPYFNDLRKEIQLMKEMEGENGENKNTVKFYESFEYNDKLVIVMELCDKSLLDYFSSRKEFNEEEIKDLLLQLNNSFKILEEKKIAHRDLSLDNILIKFINKEQTKFIAKLTDYGVSKRLTTIKNKFSTKVGKYDFMAPEILNLDSGYNQICDLWSLGIIVHVLLFRDKPYKGQNEAAQYNLINELGKNVLKKTNNEDLNNLLSRLLEKNPNNRIKWKEYFAHPFFKDKNFIVIKIDVKESDINKNIFFLDNTDFMETKIGIYKENEELKSLNDNDVKLYINGQKIDKFQKFFKPAKKGEYEIKLVFKNKLKNCSYMFSGCINIKSINLSSLDFSQTTNMSYMFTRCYYLEEIIFENINTEKVTDMSYIFNRCSNLKKIKFPSSFFSANLKKIDFMFNNCYFLENIDFNNCQTNNVTSMKGVFKYCQALKKLDLRSFDTSKTENMSYMFDHCNSLEEIKIDPNKFLTRQTTEMNFMFNDCNNLQNIDLSSFNTKKVSLLNNMFSYCNNLTKLDLSNFIILEKANLKEMFNNCSNLESLDISSLTLGNDNIINDMFKDMDKIKKIKVGQKEIEFFKNKFKVIESKFITN